MRKFHLTNKHSGINIGGVYGEFLSDYLMTNIGKPGTFFVILASLLVFSGFTFSATIPVIQNFFMPKAKYKGNVELEVNNEVELDNEKREEELKEEEINQNTT